ncbi:MAG: membrane protein insertion efficiency factor YidD [Anaerolineae bacterium]|nr:membrane protein insertion efficiency factor YidD [Anaerolineae bacterium]
MKWLALKSLRFYKRFISPALPSACRFTPTCSEYMHEAIEVHGVTTGVRLGLNRLWRCQPMYPGGLDPVPPKESDN